MVVRVVTGTYELTSLLAHTVWDSNAGHQSGSISSMNARTISKQWCGTLCFEYTDAIMQMPDTSCTELSDRDATADSARMDRISPKIRPFRLGPRQNQLGQKYFCPIQIFTLFYGPTRAHKCSSVSMTLKNFLTVPNFLTSRHQQLRLRSPSPLASATVATARVVVASLRPACAMYTPRCHPCAMAAP